MTRVTIAIVGTRLSTTSPIPTTVVAIITAAVAGINPQPKLTVKNTRVGESSRTTWRLT